MSNKSTADTADRKESTAVFGYGIYMDLLRISGMWLTVISLFPASEEHGVQRISPEGLKEGIMAECGGTMVKVLCYKSEGRWFHSRWCHWSSSLT
jgi:hypothetical protein